VANGFIRHKKVQWVFDTTYELQQFKPKEEGVYALDNSVGDIYIWNGVSWVLYYQYAVRVPVREPKIRGHFRKYIKPPEFTGSQFVYTDVDIILGNYLFIDGNKKYEIQMYHPDINPIAPLVNGFTATSSLLYASGSLIYTGVSCSIA